MNKSLVFGGLSMLAGAGAMVLFSALYGGKIPLWLFCIAVFVFAFLNLFVSFGAAFVRRIIDTAKAAINNKSNDSIEIIKTIVVCAEAARKEGILGVEKYLDEIENAFLRKGLALAVDGTEPELINKILRGEMREISARHKNNMKFWKSAAKIFAVWGLLLTLCALVNYAVLSAIAVFLCGALMSVCICLPILDVLNQKSNEEILEKEIVVEGVVSIQAGDNPRIVEQRLVVLIAANQREMVLRKR